MLVRHLLDLVQHAVHLVLGHLTLLLGLLQAVVGVPADLTHRLAGLLGITVDHLDDLLAPLLGKLGDGDADHGAVVDRVQPQVGLEDRLFNGGDGVLVVGLDHDQPRLRRQQVGHLLQRHLGAVQIDLDPIQEPHRCLARADLGQMLLEDTHGLFHAIFGVKQNLFYVHRQTPRCWFILTQTTSPRKTRRIR